MLLDLTMPAILDWVAGIVASFDYAGFFGHQAPVPVSGIALLALIAIAAALSVPNVTWRWFGLFATLVHELGHAFAALLTGRMVTGIEIRLDHSGSAASVGPVSIIGWLSSVASGFFGYPAPALVGAGLLWAVFNGYTNAALLAGTVIIAATLLFIRNLTGVLVVIGSGVASGLLWKFAPVELQSYALLILGVALLVGSVRGLIEVTRVHTSRRQELESSDAYLLFRRTLIPSPVWLVGFAVVIGWAWWVSIAGAFTNT